jgi:hypothetical protein
MLIIFLLACDLFEYGSYCIFHYPPVIHPWRLLPPRLSHVPRQEQVAENICFSAGMSQQAKRLLQPSAAATRTAVTGIA